MGERGCANRNRRAPSGGVYRPRNPRASPLGQCAKRHGPELRALNLKTGRAWAIKESLREFWSHRITNAVAEGLNSRIQTVKKAACGFRSFEHFIWRKKTAPRAYSLGAVAAQFETGKMRIALGDDPASVIYLLLPARKSEPCKAQGQEQN